MTTPVRLLVVMLLGVVFTVVGHDMLTPRASVEKTLTVATPNTDATTDNFFSGGGSEAAVSGEGARCSAGNVVALGSGQLSCSSAGILTYRAARGDAGGLVWLVLPALLILASYGVAFMAVRSALAGGADITEAALSVLVATVTGGVLVAFLNMGDSAYAVTPAYMGVNILFDTGEVIFVLATLGIVAGAIRAGISRI